MLVDDGAGTMCLSLYSGFVRRRLERHAKWSARRKCFVALTGWAAAAAAAVVAEVTADQKYEMVNAHTMRSALRRWAAARQGSY